MRNLKKFLALVLAVIMAMSLMVTVNASGFGDNDEINDTYEDAVDVLTALGVIKGYETDDGDIIFQPTKSIKRSEAAALLYRVVTGDVNDEYVHLYDGVSTYSDVQLGYWYTPYINYCTDNGLIVGVGNDRFAPDSDITGYQILVMILRAIGYNAPDEFTGSDWRMKATGYATRLGIIKNIVAGSLGAAAERQVVAEILFRGIQAPTVTYNPLTLYTSNVLVAGGTKTSYYDDVAGANKEKIVYPTTVYSTLMYEVFDIVGLHENLARDAYGRPQYAWVKDQPGDKVELGTKYVPNCDTPLDDTVAGYIDATVTDDTVWTARKNADVSATGSYAPCLITMAYIDIEDNGIDECYLATKINNDSSINWADITEFLNGGDGNAAAHALTTRPGKMDALHTTTDYIGQTGRTTEIYKYADPATGNTKWTFVYIDTFLGEVVDTTEAILDTNNHVIREAKAIVEVGNDIAAAGGITAGAAAPVRLTLSNANGKYEVGQVVLVQTSGGVETTLDAVDLGEKAPVTPDDVPDTFVEFFTESTIVGTATKVSGVTVTGTVGKDDAKMGITVQGRTDPYYASNTFLAARADNKTVLERYYDVGPANLGINNGMIGKTYDLYLDHHGYIVGLVEVDASTSTVGVITSIDGKRLATGKYVVEVEAFMDDETTQTFDLINVTDLTYKNTTGAAFFTSISNAGDAFGNGGTYQALGIGSLVRFGQTSLGGYDVWYIADWDNNVAADTMMAGETYGALGRVDYDNVVRTGVADTLNTAADNSTISTVTPVNDETTFFVAEYDFRYNQIPGQNTGGYSDKSYTVYKGFKNLPTITDTGSDDNILYQAIGGNNVLIYAKDIENDYTVTAQAKIAVDESYLVLSRGTTYAEYSTYNVLKNGEPETLNVANLNNNVNSDIDNAMIAGDLIVVTSQNNKGYVTGVSTVNSIADANIGPVTVANAPRFKDLGDAGVDVVAYDKGVLTVTANNDGSGNDSEFLTVADDCKVMIVNISRGTYYASTLAIAMDYAIGLDGSGGENALLDEHYLVYELNDLGYVCTLYVLD